MFVREHTRYPVELAVRMKCASWADYVELHTSNLSRGGLFVPSAMSAPIGTEIAIELALPNGSAVKLRGEVVHVAEASGEQIAGMGIMFFANDGEAARAIEAALTVAKANAPRPLMRAVPPPPPAGAMKPKAPPPAPAKLAPVAVRVAAKPAPVAAPVAAKPAPVAAPVAAKPAPVAAKPMPAPLPPPPTSDGWDVPAPAPAPEARAPKFADAVEQALLDELARRMDLRPLDQLGVKPDVADAELIEAYDRLRERYAPSIFARYGSSTAAVVRSINDQIETAYRALQDPNARRALVIAAHQPKTVELSPTELEQKRRGEEARAALRAGIERRVQEACSHRDLQRIDDAIRSFEQVLELDRKHDYARAELAKLRDLKAKRKR